VGFGKGREERCVRPKPCAKADPCSSARWKNDVGYPRRQRDLPPYLPKNGLKLMRFGFYYSRNRDWTEPYATSYKGARPEGYTAADFEIYFNEKEGMKWVQNTWTRRFNRRHKQWGRLFGDRYKSILCDDGVYLQALINWG